MICNGLFSFLRFYVLLRFMLITAIVITLELQLIMYQLVIHTYISVADSDLELRRGPGLDLLALLAFFPSVISSFFYPK